MFKFRLVKFWKEHYDFSEELISAFLKVKREGFVLEEFKEEAYSDIALPIFSEQTISQPTTVMLMLNYLDVFKGCKVLEIGSGSGYVCALLSELGCNVVGVEVDSALVSFSKKNLRGYKNVKIVLGDGSVGYSEDSPYDRILYSCACPSIPEVVLKQLKRDGVLVAPVGSGVQKLVRIREGKREVLGDFVFVPLKGELGFKKI